MTNVTINFSVPSEFYGQYEGILQEFLNYLDDIRIKDIEVTEA